MTKADIQLIRSLDDKRARQETRLFVAEGEKLVRDLLASEFRIRKIYCTEMVSTTFSNIETISQKEMERASHLKSATDCLALVEIPRHTLPDRLALRGELVLALDGVQNPGNMGTIVRLADWFGIRHILCSPDCADCWNPKVVQATMGALARVAVHYGDLPSLITSAALPVYGTFLDGDNIYEADLTPEGVIVLGSEGRGISAEIERLVERRLFIPPFSPDTLGSESLNVAIAAAIVCSEFRRR